MVEVNISEEHSARFYSLLVNFYSAAVVLAAGHGSSVSNTPSVHSVALSDIHGLFGDLLASLESQLNDICPNSARSSLRIVPTAVRAVTPDCYMFLANFELVNSTQASTPLERDYFHLFLILFTVLPCFYFLKLIFVDRRPHILFVYFVHNPKSNKNKNTL